MVDGCERPHSSKGYCSIHYGRMYRTGKLETELRKVKVSLEERLWFRTRIVPHRQMSDCWISDRAPTRRVRDDAVNSYRGVRIGKNMIPVHLASYRHFKGPIPEGHQVHHLCGNKPCWRPDHLIAVTPAEHRKYHYTDVCSNGHVRTPENTRVRTTKQGWVTRNCLVCIKQWNREAYERRLAQQATAST